MNEASAEVLGMVKHHNLTVNYGHSTHTYSVGNGQFTLDVSMGEEAMLAWLRGFGNGKAQGLVDGIGALETLAHIR